MNIEFINKNTVKVSASMAWDGKRPPQSARGFVKKPEVIEAFNKKHPGYRVKNITGPEEICNFRNESNSRGEWLLTVVKLRLKPKKRPVNSKSTLPPRSVKKTIKKGA
jgi:hypothetical protein